MAGAISAFSKDVWANLNCVTLQLREMRYREVRGEVTFAAISKAVRGRTRPTPDSYTSILPHHCFNGYSKISGLQNPN